MIFVTVGTQLPFPRLIDAMDRIAATADEKVVAQVGPEKGDWPNLEHSATLTPDQFEALFADARLIVAHAGIGTILSSKRHGKPLVVLPRRHALGEHRNDHQMATAKAIEALPGIHVAWEASDLAALAAASDLEPATDAPSPTGERLVARLAQFIDGS